MKKNTLITKKSRTKKQRKWYIGEESDGHVCISSDKHPGYVECSEEDATDVMNHYIYIYKIYDMYCRLSKGKLSMYSEIVSMSNTISDTFLNDMLRMTRDQLISAIVYSRMADDTYRYKVYTKYFIYKYKINEA